ncbi:MAG: hypothetical protein ACTSVE_05675 [Candidatus Helarchaeota archaeon]
MTTIIEHVKEVLEREDVKGLRFVRGNNWYQDYKKKKHEILFLDDGIVFYEKKGSNHTIIPLHSTTIFLLK